MKWKLEIEMKLLEKNGIRIEIEIFFKMEITLIDTMGTQQLGSGNAHNPLDTFPVVSPYYTAK